MSKRPFCMWSLRDEWNLNLWRESRYHSNIQFFSNTLIVAHHLLFLFPTKLSALFSYFSSVWTCAMKQNDKQVTSASHPGRHTLLCPPILLQPGVGSRNVASPSVVVHLLSLCECEGCSLLRQTLSSSTYPSMEHQWQDEWACMRLGIGGVLLG